MDAEPKALRPYILLSTTFVVVGVVAAYGVWHLAATRPSAEALLPAAAEATASRPVDFPAGTTAAERARIEALVARLTADPGAAAPEADERALLAAGRTAAPALLTALHRALSTPGTPEARIAAIDALLGRLRAGLTPAYAPEPWPASADRAAIERRARAWFAWWDAQAAAEAPVKGSD